MKRRRFLAACCTSPLLPGCTHHAALHVRAEGWPRLQQPPRIIAPRGLALVLGSGGPRGFAHVGMLKALHELAITPDLIVGSSVGAVIGALLAARTSAMELEKLALKLTAWDVSDLSWNAIQTRSYYTGASVAGMVARLCEQRDIAAMPIPLAIAATRSDRREPEAAVFNAGNLALALQASIAIVNKAPEVQIAEARYCDGDLAAPVPARIAQSLGAKRVVAVDVSAYDEDTPDWVKTDMPQWMAEAKRRNAITREERKQAQLYLHIRSPYYAGFSKAYREQLIELGYQQTMKERDALRKLASA